MTEEQPPPPPAQYVREEVATPPPRRPLIWPWLLLLLLVVVVGLAAAYFLTRNNESKPHVPNVVGESGALAVRDLGRHGYASDVRVQVASGSDVGRVISQAPAGGTELDRGRTVTIVVGRGPSKAGVPGVVGLSVAQAFVRLQSAGLKGTVVKVSSTRPKDTVLAQKPAAGAQAKTGTTVVLTIAKGPKGVSVPPVVGLTQASATALLDRLGFKVSVSRARSSKPAGIVSAQTPAGGAKAPTGSVVAIDVSTGPAGTGTTPTTTTTATATTTIPKVVGRGQLDAITRLEGAGLRVDSYPVQSTRSRGLVVRQQPPGGTSAPRLTLVRIDVSIGPGARPLRVVPDVTGKSETDARHVLAQEGFTVRTVPQPTTDPSQANTVLDQKPAPGQRVPTTSQIRIYVGRSPSATS